MKSLKERLIEIIIEKNIVSQKDLDQALSIQKERGGSLTKILIGLHPDLKDRLLGALSKQLDIPPINLSRYKIDIELFKLVPEQIARAYMLVPISKMEDTLIIAMADPLNIIAIDELKMLTHFKIEPLLSSEEEIKKAIDAVYAQKSQPIEQMIEEASLRADIEIVNESETAYDIKNIIEESQAAPVVKIVSLILDEAMRKRSSDIHIEPNEAGLRVRYRIDGDLQDALTLPKQNQNAVIARLKIMSGLDITESRLPQDGRFKIKLSNREIDFRVSALPITYGQKIVLRALDKGNLSIGLDGLGFLPDTLMNFKEAVKRPYGMILVTGPTGSGKSTTLYSVINQLNTPERNIITIEDPVEYQVEGITQIQIKPEIGLTFASGLRSLLRQNPDVIMIGEIRDFETADIAIKASLTGTLVLSTLHTNDAPSAITRLTDMGVEPYLIASSVILVAAQRLIRKLCTACRQEHIMDAALLKEAGLTQNDVLDKKLYKPKGCKQCFNTGFHGRMGILETFLVDDTIKELIVKKASSDQLKNYAVSKGMRTLRQDGIEKFLLGLTSLEEIIRVTSEE